ncbi:MAG: DUF2188 domain-containing protein [Chlamydiia bacterium]|nr:DUF2188 domain-containing protein [Chlamydiia bacterium]
MRKEFVNVIPNKQKGCWSIHRGMSKTPSKSCKTKAQAEAWARGACRKWGMSLALYNLDGKLARRNSFVKPTRPVKAAKIAKPFKAAKPVKAAKATKRTVVRRKPRAKVARRRTTRR